MDTNEGKKEKNKIHDAKIVRVYCNEKRTPAQPKNQNCISVAKRLLNANPGKERERERKEVEKERNNFFLCKIHGMRFQYVGRFLTSCFAYIPFTSSIV